ncbi:MAG: hypothetical protein J6X02_04100 [Bacilli bacterium]|nr:hypothetical protein [Bacilli bacterium]
MALFRLRRKKLLKVFDKYSKKINDSDKLSGKDYQLLFFKLTRVLKNHKYENDIKFDPRGRRNFLKEEIISYLKEGKYKEALGDFHEYIYDCSYLYNDYSSFSSDEEARKAQEYNLIYNRKGYICREDKEIILIIIELFRYYLKIN